MKQINIVFKIIFPLVLGMFLIATVSVYTNFFLLEKNISKKADETFEVVSKSFSSIVKQDTNLMLGLIEQLEKDQKTINYYKNGDRESLYNYLVGTYQSYNNRYDITHFYIHQPNKQNFIRIHNKNKHSDMITRTTLDIASKNLTLSSGIEFGILHNLTLRVVLPWFVDGELIGFLELGKEVDKLTPHLSKSINVDIVFTVNKELISQDNFEKWKQNNRNRHYEVMQNYYIIDSTINTINNNLLEHLDETVSHKDHEHDYVDNGTKRYFIHTSPFLDINNKKVGKFFTLIDISEEYEFLCLLLVKVSIVVVILILLMVIYYYKLLRGKENELNELYQEVQRVSITDALTDLFNKRHYLNNTPKQMNHCIRCNGYISFILIDVDKFKKYNDHYGHLKGDDVLINIASIMQNVFKRASECSYRVGGEEFLVVTTNKDEKNAMIMAEKLRQAINEEAIEHVFNNNKIVTVSMGICTKKATTSTLIEELYDNADKALYHSKNNGRNQVTTFESIT